MQIITKKAGVAILMSDKINFKTKITTRYKVWQYVLIKAIICQEDTAIINIYELNNREPKIYVGKTDRTEGVIDSFTIIVSRLKYPISNNG